MPSYRSRRTRSPKRKSHKKRSSRRSHKKRSRRSPRSHKRMSSSGRESAKIRYFKRAIRAGKPIYGSWKNDTTGHWNRLTRKDVEMYRKLGGR